MGFCTKCGGEIPEGNQFCQKCGAAVDGGSRAQEMGSVIETSQQSANDKKVMGPWLGIASLVIAVVAIFINNIVGLILLDIAIVIAIICLYKRCKLKGFPIAAIVVVIVMLTLGTLVGEPLITFNADGTFTINTKESVDGVDPELKEFLDSYEDFVDDYVAFMKKYYKNPTDLSLLSEYSEFLQKYTEMASQVDDFDINEMSEKDYDYYLEVTSRCTEKLLSVANYE